jgi:hypothetical protein
MIRSAFYGWKLKRLKKRKNIPGDDLVSSLKNIDSILILCSEKNTAIMTFYNSLQKIFPNVQINTWVYDELNEKQRLGNHGVRKEAGEKLAEDHFGMIIDAAPYVTREWFYFVSLLSADILAGISKTDEYHIYNLLITFNTGKTSADGFRMVTDYLTKLVGH